MNSAIRFYRVRVAFSFAHLILLLAGSGWIVANPEVNLSFPGMPSLGRKFVQRSEYICFKSSHPELLA